MPKQKSAKQVRFLFSKGSPLKPGQKEKLAGELRSGVVKVKGGKSKIGKSKRKKK